MGKQLTFIGTVGGVDLYMVDHHSGPTPRPDGSIEYLQFFTAFPHMEGVYLKPSHGEPLLVENEGGNRVVIFHPGQDSMRIDAGETYSSGTAYGGACTLLRKGETFLYYALRRNDAYRGVAGEGELTPWPHPTQTRRV